MGIGDRGGEEEDEEAEEEGGGGGGGRWKMETKKCGCTSIGEQNECMRNRMSGIRRGSRSKWSEYDVR